MPSYEVRIKATDVEQGQFAKLVKEIRSKAAASGIETEEEVVEITEDGGEQAVQLPA